NRRAARGATLYRRSLATARRSCRYGRALQAAARGARSLVGADGAASQDWRRVALEPSEYRAVASCKPGAHDSRPGVVGAPGMVQFNVCDLVPLAHSGIAETRAARDYDLAIYARETLGLGPDRPIEGGGCCRRGRG